MGGRTCASFLLAFSRLRCSTLLVHEQRPARRMSYVLVPSVLVCCSWLALRRRRALPLDPQPTTSKHIEMSRCCGPDARDPRGGSSQFTYWPYLLALSNPKKSLGRGRPPPCTPPCAAARRGRNGGYSLLQGGGDLDLSQAKERGPRARGKRTRTRTQGRGFCFCIEYWLLVADGGWGMEGRGNRARGVWGVAACGAW
jgi:hypothetical protein